MKKASLTACAGHSVSWPFSVMLVSLSMTTAMAQPTTVQVLPGIEVKDGNLEFRQFGNLEITGSSIVRKNQTKALPVQVITREDIKRSGLSTLTEAVQSVTTMFNNTESAQFDSGGGGGIPMPHCTVFRTAP